MRIEKANFVEKQKKLNEVKEVLKREFFGIDQVIDNLIANFSSWYLFNNLQERPLVINLWGMTGTGKTSLIKRIGELLDYEKRLFHFEMSETGMYSVDYELLRIYEAYNGQPNIIVFDEFQHLRSKDEDGKYNNNSIAQTVWKITDSGKFEYFPKFHIDNEDLRKIEQLKKALKSGVVVKNGEVTGNKDAFIHITKMEIYDNDNFFEESGRAKQRFKEQLAETSLTEQYDLIKKKKRIRFINYNLLEHIVRNTHNTGISIESLDEEFSKLNGKESIERLVNYIEEALSPQILDCTKSVVFVCGNLDDAYPMAQSLNPDIDADFIYKQSLEVDVIKIKEALSNFLRYEQISRLGNTHLIYPALSKSAYQQIIEVQLKKVSEKVKNNNKLKLSFTDALKEALYYEGVFPTQGVRPLLSSLSQNINGKLGELIGEINLKGISSSQIKWDFKDDNFLISYLDSENNKIHQKVIRPSFSLALLRQKNSGEKRVITAVHEAGHTVVQRILFEESPEMVVSSTAGGGSAGFTINKQIDFYSYESSVKKIAIALGGYCAEKLVFGLESITSGSSSDLKQASILADTIADRWQMKRFKQSHIFSDSFYRNYTQNEVEAREELLSEAFSIAENVLKKNEKLHLAIADELIKKNYLSKEEIERVVKKEMPQLKAKLQKNENGNYYIHCFKNKKADLSL